MLTRTTTSAFSITKKACTAKPLRRSCRRWSSTPKMQVAQRNLEVAYFSTGYYDRRVSALRDQLRTAPDDRNARWELGLLGRFTEAVAEFKELLRHHPHDLGTMVQLGLAEKASGYSTSPAAVFERALALDPTARSFISTLGRCCTTAS